MKTKSKLLDFERRKTIYDFVQTRAIVQTPKGRLYIQQGFGGINQLRGGAVRWVHGLAVRIPDTLETLSELDSSVGFSTIENEYEVLNWDGRVIEAIAKMLGL